MNESSHILHLPRRMRRNRSTPALRRLVQETKLHHDDFIQPLFFHGGVGTEEISSMPGIVRHSFTSLVEKCQQLADNGLSAVALFPCIDASQKTATADHAFTKENILYKAIQSIKAAVPSLAVIADVALDPYTSHGHDGILNQQGSVENDITVKLLTRLAIMEAEAGADVVAPSDMMDGRVRAIRTALDQASFHHVGILAYSAKYASAYYGPFRDAVQSKTIVPLDKQDYQMDSANLREALLEVELDEEEGADMIMVKPAGPYLDVIRAVREKTLLPVVAYQVSGEYAQIVAAARLGWLDYEATRNESLLAIKRAGASMILTYFAEEILKKV